MRDLCPASLLLFVVFVVAGCRSNDELPTQEGFVTTADSVRLYYRSVGGGDTVVVIPMAMYLANSRRIAGVMLRGQWLSRSTITRMLDELASAGN